MNHDPHQRPASNPPKSDGQVRAESPDELSDVLAQVDSQLAALRRIRDERDQKMLEVTQREAELAEARVRFEAREKQFTEEQAQLEALEQELSTRDKDFARRDAELKQHLDRLGEERSRVEQLSRAAAQEKSRLEQLARALEERERQDAAKIEEFKRVAEQAAAGVEAARREAQEASGKAQDLQRQLDQSAKAIEKAKTEFEQRLSQQKQRLEAAAAEAARASEQRSAAMTEEVTRLTARVQELDFKIKQREQQVGQLVQAVSEYEAEIERLSTESRKTTADGAAVAERDAKIRALESSVAQLRQELENASRDRSVGSAALTAEVDRLRAEVVGRDQQIQELRKGAGDGATQTDALRAEIAGREKTIKELKSKSDADAARIAELEKAAESQTPGNAKKEMDKLRNELARRDEAIRTLHARLEKQPAAGAPGKLGARELQQIESRRSRLAKYRDVLREKTEKLSRAKATIESRYQQLQKATEEIKQLDEIRRTVAAEKISLQRLERRLEKARARSNAWMLIASFFVTLGVLGLGSWWAVGQFVKPTYLAHTTIAIDAAGGEPSAAQIESWQSFHEGLISDPKLLSTAADRMRRRGMDTLGTAGDIDWHLKENLDVTSQRPGEITLTLRGQGGPRTERILGTLATAMVGMSAETRDLRADRAGAAIIEPVKVDAAPIEDPRLAIFGVVFGAAAALTLFASVIAGRKMASSKEEFEEVMAQPEPAFSPGGSTHPDDSVPPHGTITGGPPARRPV